MKKTLTIENLFKKQFYRFLVGSILILMAVFYAHFRIVEKRIFTELSTQLEIQLNADKDQMISMVLLNQEQPLEELLQKYKKAYMLNSIKIKDYPQTLGTPIRRNLYHLKKPYKHIFYFTLGLKEDIPKLVRLEVSSYKLIQNDSLLEIYGMLLVITCLILVCWQALSSQALRTNFTTPLKDFIHSLSKIDLKSEKLSKPIQNNHNEKLLEQETLEQKVYELIESLNFANQVRKNQAIQVKLAEQARQVSHDIQSPLTVLEMVLSEMESIPDSEKKLIRSSVARIKEILADLKHTQAASSTANQVQLLYPIIENIVHEKKRQVQNKDITIDINAQGNEYVFVNLEAAKFKRVLSNLLNNSIEACGDSGLIQIKLQTQGDKILTLIEDSGSGIPDNILDKIGIKGTTANKPHGSGLGLHDAIQTLKSWNGSFKIISTSPAGTLLQITLIRATQINN